MPEGQLEEVVTEFERGEYDVLVCTTIIEAGIDIANVNTLIVDDADRFGLAQLHHIRGRVGRGAKQGFAYLLVQPNKSLTEEADARLNTILAATELGSGYKIAMRDLEIRGMGQCHRCRTERTRSRYRTPSIHSTPLPIRRRTPSQDGTVSKRRNRKHSDAPSNANGAPTNGRTTKLLSKAGHRLNPPSMVRADIRLGIDDNVPPEYIEDLAQRLSFHQRLSWVASEDEIGALGEELRDRYGPIPESVEGILETVPRPTVAEQADCASVRANGERARILMNTPVGGAKNQLNDYSDQTHASATPKSSSKPTKASTSKNSSKKSP